MRSGPVVFSAAEKPTVPLLVPELPEVIVTQEALLTAVQKHSGPAVTLTLPEPPVALNDSLTGEIVKVHPDIVRQLLLVVA